MLAEDAWLVRVLTAPLIVALVKHFSINSQLGLFETFLFGMAR